MKFYDLIIIGSGPAGVMAAKTASDKGMSTLIIEKGRDLIRRRDLTMGWFGQGLYKMDRLDLEDPALNNPKAVRKIFNLIKKLYHHKIKILTSKGKGNKYCRLDPKFGMILASYFFEKFKSDVIFNTEVLKIENKNSYFKIHTTGNKFKSRRCVIATGKNSIDWINFLCKSFNLKPAKNSVRIGVRVEVPTFRVNEMLADRGDIKMEDGYVSADDARTNSFVGEWEESNILSAFGHNMPEKKSAKTNFMVGVEVNKTLDNVIREVQIVNILANDRIRRERVIDYMQGRSILKHMKEFDQLRQAFISLEKTIPSFVSYATMYIPEVRLKGVLPVESSMNTEIPRLYGAGECTSRVSTLIGAMASGSIAAQTILKE